MTEHRCPCGVWFHARRSDALYCSAACRTLASKVMREAVTFGPELPPGTKVCRGACGRLRSLDEFYSSSGKRSRVSTHCRTCKRDQGRAATRERYGLPADAPLTDRPRQEVVIHRGYRMVHHPEHHRAWRDGRVYEHIVVAEDKYGMPIGPEWTVHHRNRDKADNRPENLELRLGNHGKGGDAIPTLLHDPDLREQAVATLRAYGYVVTASAATVAA